VLTICLIYVRPFSYDSDEAREEISMLGRDGIWVDLLVAEGCEELSWLVKGISSVGSANGPILVDLNLTLTQVATIFASTCPPQA
jgi:hypothetical protein